MSPGCRLPVARSRCTCGRMCSPPSLGWVYGRLGWNLLKNDRAKTKVLRMSQFGIIELTRQRMRPSLKRSIYFDCPHCKGSGLVKTPESMSLDVMRRLAIALNDMKVARAELSVCPDVSFYLLKLPVYEAALGLMMTLIVVTIAALITA